MCFDICSYVYIICVFIASLFTNCRPYRVHNFQRPKFEVEVGGLTETGNFNTDLNIRERNEISVFAEGQTRRKFWKSSFLMLLKPTGQEMEVQSGDDKWQPLCLSTWERTAV